MKFIQGFTLLTTLLSSTITFSFQESSEDVIKLYKPKFKKGEIIISKSIVEIIDAKITSSSIPKGDNLNLQRRHRGVSITEIIETDKEGDISEVLENHLVLSDDSRVFGKVGGKDIDEAKNEHSPLEDATIRYIQKKGIWVGSLSEGETTKEMAGLLEGYISPEESSFLPKKAISLGDSWVIKGAALRKFEPEALSLDGSAELTFEKIVTINGRSHALIKGVIEIKTTFLDELKNELKSRTNASLNIWIDIKTGIETLAEGKGVVVVEGAVGEFKDGKIAGQVLLSSSQRLFKKP